MDTASWGAVHAYDELYPAIAETIKSRAGRTNRCSPQSHDQVSCLTYFNIYRIDFIMSSSTFQGTFAQGEWPFLGSA